MLALGLALLLTTLPPVAADCTRTDGSGAPYPVCFDPGNGLLLGAGVQARDGEWVTSLRAGLLVRVGGWLFLDPEHPDQIGRTRVTIWEVHPVVTWDVQTPAGDWVPLDTYTPPARPTAPRRPRRAAAGR